MKVGFVMDPIEAVNIDADTTFAFMLAACERGHEVFYIQPHTMGFDGSDPVAVLEPIVVRRAHGDHFTLSEGALAPMHSLDVLFMRKDPPFDVDYLHDAHLLEIVEARGTLVVNRPRGLMAANEKLYALTFAEAIPRTLVSRDSDLIKAFVAGEPQGKAVLKPLDGHGGEGIFVLERGDKNINAIIEVSTRNGKEAVMVQQYIPEVRQGDKRIVMLDGEPLGGILRVPRADEHRGNIHVGGTVVKAELTPRDLELCAMVAPKLREEGLWFVGLDVIGDYVTEVNVTSPTGIQEMSRLNGVDGAGLVIEWAERRVG